MHNNQNKILLKRTLSHSIKIQFIIISKSKEKGYSLKWKWDEKQTYTKTLNFIFEIIKFSHFISNGDSRSNEQKSFIQR